MAMMLSKQVLGNFGLRRDGARRRLTRARQMAERTGRDVFNTVPTTYLWLGLGVAAACAALAVTDRATGWRGRRRVADVMVRDVVTIDASATLLEAAQRMRDHNVGVLPVVEGGRLRGLITDRDLVVRAMARNMDPSATPVRYVATEDLACANPDWDVEDAMAAMGDAQVGRLPVVDDSGRVVGIVTLSSLALRSQEQREALETAQKVSRRSSRVA